MQDNELEVTCYEINEKDYLVLKLVNYKDEDYLYLVNKDDDKDVILKRLINGELEPVKSKLDAYNVLKMISNNEIKGY